MNSMDTNRTCNVSKDWLLNYTDCNTVMIKKAMKNSLLTNEMVEFKKKVDRLKGIDFKIFNKNNTIRAEKRRESWQNNCKSSLGKSFMVIEKLNDCSRIEMNNESEEISNSDCNKGDASHNMDNSFNSKLERAHTILHIMPSKENTEDQETNKRCKERDGILKKNEIVEKSLINHNFISMDLESNLKVIDCCPNERYYQFNEQIGKGSYKNVYKAYDKSSKIYVAWCETNYAHLKIRGIGKLREEIYLLSLLSHENILPLLNYWEYKIKGVKGTNVVMITEYFDAGSLKNHIKTLDCVPKCCIQTWGRQILNGISYLHNHNPPIIHRDLKCDNILYDKKCDILKICDLGYAIFKGNFNNEGVIGTPEFMAPEMFSEQYDEGVDIYAFGMCLLEMVTGEYPYQECRKPNDLYNLVTNNVKPLCLGKISNIYSDIKMIIERCIRNRRNERWNVDELLEDELFTDFNKFEIKIKSSCYKEYLLRDSPLFTLEIIGNTKRLISKDFELTFSIFTFDCEREKHFDVANRLIEDFHISVKFKYQLIEQLERYVKTRKRFIKFREIECENEEKYSREKMTGDEENRTILQNLNNNTLVESVVPVSFVRFSQILKEWNVTDKLTNDKNPPFIAVKVLEYFNISKKAFRLLFMNKKRQTVVITCLQSCIPERIVKQLVYYNIIDKDCKEKMMSILVDISNKIDDISLNSLPIKLLFFLGNTSVKKEKKRYTKNLKYTLNKKNTSLESIDENDHFQETSNTQYINKQLDKEIPKNWNLQIDGTLNVPINELKDNIFKDNGNFSLENGTLSMLFKYFTPNVFASNAFSVYFERDNISHLIKSNHFETFFNVYTKDFDKYIKKCHYLSHIAIMKIENKIKSYFSTIELTQKRALMMKKSLTYSGSSNGNNDMNNDNIVNNNVKKVFNKKGSKKSFQISKVCLDDVAKENDPKILTRKRSITIALPTIVDSPRQAEIINMMNIEENLKTFNDKMIFHDKKNNNCTKRSGFYYNYLLNPRIGRKSLSYEDLFYYDKRGEDFFSKRQISFDSNIMNYFKKKTFSDGTSENVSVDKNVDKTTSGGDKRLSDNPINKKDPLVIISLKSSECSDTQSDTTDFGKAKENVEILNVNSTNEPEEHSVNGGKLQKSPSICADLGDDICYEVKCAIARNKHFYKADSLKNDCNFVDDGSIEKKKKVSELSKQLAELINNGFEHQSPPPSEMSAKYDLVNGSITNNDNSILRLDTDNGIILPEEGIKQNIFIE